MSCYTCVPISNICYRVVVSLREEEENIVKKINREEWIFLLQQNTSDWAANLILYGLYDKDAFILSRNNSKELWKQYLKLDDVKYWDRIIK